MRIPMMGAACLAAFLFTADVAFAHGGQYRGPKDVVPPTAGGGNTGRPGGAGRGGNPVTPGPRHPGGPAPTPGVTPGRTGAPHPGGVGGTTRTGGGMPMVFDDLTVWTYWWEFNKSPYLGLKGALHSGVTQTGSDDFFVGFGRRTDSVDLLEPTPEQIRDLIQPALSRALDEAQERDADIISSCMVALAKIGTDHREFRLVDLFAERLDARNQEIRETAALALGIAGPTGQLERQLGLLTGLALDSPAGREACRRAEVDDRTRAFATYGLGLLCWHTRNEAVKQAAFTTLERVLNDERRSSRNLRVAAISALSLLNPETDHAAGPLADQAVACLRRFYEQPWSPGEQLVAAHCPTAIAKLLTPDHPQAEAFRALFAADLRGRSKRSSNDIARSCALALGRLCRPVEDENSPDARYGELLLDAWREHKDAQTRYFAVLALGQIGGEHHRTTLLQELRRSKNLARPWCALALGVLGFDLLESDDPDAARRVQTIGDALRDVYRDTRREDLLGALAIALGLCRHREAAVLLREQLDGKLAREDLAGYTCIGLALMKDRESRELVSDVMALSTRKPRLMQQAAVALGVLGDRFAAATLQDLLGTADGNLAKLAALAGALGQIGDRRSVDPLCRMLADRGLSQLSRAFCAVALGGIADKELLPWNSKLAVNTNYRASVETLTNRSTGILDIL